MTNHDDEFDSYEVQKLPVVEIQPAFVWICDDCGKENYDRPKMITVMQAGGTREEAEECYREQFGLEDFVPLPEGWESELYEFVPVVVDCQHCGRSFETLIPGDEDCDGEGE